jgi:hypothetical protein
MDMRIPMEQLSKRLDGPNHAGNHIRQVQHAPDFGLDAIPSAGGKFAQQLAIKTCVNSQTLGDGKNHLSVRNGKTNIFGDVDACHKGAFLVAGWAGASLFAGEGNEHFMFTVRATNSGKAFMQIATLEIGCYRLLDDRSPVAILGLVPLVVNLLKRVKMLVD